MIENHDSPQRLSLVTKSNAVLSGQKLIYPRNSFVRRTHINKFDNFINIYGWQLNEIRLCNFGVAHLNAKRGMLINAVFKSVDEEVPRKIYITVRGQKTDIIMVAQIMKCGAKMLKDTYTTTIW